MLVPEVVVVVILLTSLDGVAVHVMAIPVGDGIEALMEDVCVSSDVACVVGIDIS